MRAPPPFPCFPSMPASGIVPAAVSPHAFADAKASFSRRANYDLLQFRGAWPLPRIYAARAVNRRWHHRHLAGVARSSVHKHQKRRRRNQRRLYTIKGVLDTARTYAKANNTYTWVGFYEEDATAATPTNNNPPYPGKGRVLIATVASKDGTKIFEDTDPATALPPDRIRQVGKLVKVEGIHLTDIGNPSPTPNPTPIPDTLLARPYTPYTEGSPFDHFNRIGSDSSDGTLFRFTAQNYTFYKTIRFNPRGEANINSTYTVKHQGEIGVKPTHGTSC